MCAHVRTVSRPHTNMFYELNKLNNNIRCRRMVHRPRPPRRRVRSRCSVPSFFFFPPITILRARGMYFPIVFRSATRRSFTTACRTYRKYILFFFKYTDIKTGETTRNNRPDSWKNNAWIPARRDNAFSGCRPINASRFSSTLPPYPALRIHRIRHQKPEIENRFERNSISKP